ncbi:MAG: ATP-binding protein [Bacteroidales bacterium]|nr:ATP-binding protein [Bacteroidales bacterium]
MSSSKNITKEIISDFLKLRSDATLFHRESQTLEFKESYNHAGLAEYFRDFAAFANNKGGYLIFGIKDRPKRERVGMSEKSLSLFDAIDPEKDFCFFVRRFFNKNRLGNGHNFY